MNGRVLALVALFLVVGVALLYVVRAQVPPMSVSSLSSPTPTAPAPAPTSSSAAATTRVAPDVANQALAARARHTGRPNVAICLYVDPGTGLDPNAALTSLQGSIDALVRQGYTVLGTRPASLCPQAPHFIRTSSVHPKNSGNGPVAGVPTVTTPSAYQLVFAVTTTARINMIFGGFTSHRGSEETTCSGNNCAPVTESVYADAASFASAAERERLLLYGFGLLGS